MFWIYDENILNNKNIIFYQILNNNTFEINDNYIYQFNLIDINLTNYEHKKINYQIKIIGDFISFKDINLNKYIFFNKNETFIKPEENKLSKPIFYWSYKLISKHEMPDLLSNLYDYFYENLEFDVYKINNDLLFIKEINKINNCCKNYWIANSLDIKII